MENPYWQFFCGFQFFQHEPPIDASTMTHWQADRARGAGENAEGKRRRRTRDGTAQPGSLERITVDTTVQPKAIAHPPRRRPRVIRPPNLPHLRAVKMMAEATRRRGSKSRSDDHRSGDSRSNDDLFDRELDHVPAEVRWRGWMARVEAIIFAASEPVTRETLARIVGKSCSIGLLIDDIREELRGRPYDLVAVAGGFRHLTRSADDIRSAFGTAVGGNQRVGGPAQPDAGRALHLCHELLEFRLDTMRDLPDFEALEDAGLLSKEKLLAGDIMPGFSNDADGDAAIAGDE